MSSTRGSPEDRQVQPEESADQTRKAVGATFRVCTAQDFGTSSRQERARRRPGMPSVACQTCRSRKIRCEVDPPTQRADTSSGFPPCQACQRSNIECSWNTVDKRKRRRVRVSHERLDDDAYETSETIIVADDGSPQPGMKPRLVDGSLEPQSKEQRETEDQGNSRQEDADWARITSPNSRDDASRHNDRETTSNTTFESGEQQGPQSQPREFFALENMDMSGDWSGIQDFVLDFEGMETIGAIDWDNGLEDGILKTVTEPSRTPGKAIRLRFSRRFGPTAVIPGMRRLSLAVRAHPDDGSVERDHESPATPYSRSGLSTKRSSIATRQDEDSPYDLPVDVIYQVLDVFFERFGGHFPFIERQVLIGHLRSGQLSSFLLNSITALTMPFCSLKVPRGIIDQGLEESWRKGTYFLKRAKEQLVTLLSIPATDVVSGLVILAWAEFGDNNEAGLWMLSGMAIRMAQDMGLHKPPESDTGLNATSYYHSPISPDGSYLLSEEQSKRHQQMSALALFWAVFSLDVCVSLLTGRPPSLRRTEIEVSIPTLHDMEWTQLDFQESTSMKHIVFPEMVRFMLFFSEAVELLNQPCGSHPDDAGGADGSHVKDVFSDIRERLMRQYQSLCPELTFNIENYKRASSSRQAGPFLMLHIYFYTFMTLLSDRGTRNNAVASGGTELSQPSKAALMASQKIVQILNTAELINNNGYLATPFTNHGLFVAASTILAGQQADENSLCHQSQDLFSLVSESDFDYLCQKILEISHYFRGTGATLAALERKKRELVARKSRTKHSSEDEDSEEEKDAAVQLSDPGIVNRYSMSERDG